MYTCRPAVQRSRRGIVSSPICKIILKAKKPCHKHYPKELITYGDHIRKKRLDSDLSKKEVAIIMNVTEETISGWEKGKSTPQTSYVPRIISFLGYSPISYVNYLKQYRKERGLTAVKLAKILKVDARTITKIESGEKVRKNVVERIKYTYENESEVTNINPQLLLSIPKSSI